ncbi:MAG: hypothetical protein U0610_29100 [bacterium]
MRARTADARLQPSHDAELAQLLGAPIPHTTSGAIAVRNLESQIRASEGLLARSPHEPRVLRDLGELLLARAQYLSRLADYDRAAALAEQLVQLAPKQHESWLLRASTRAAFHRFDDALDDLDRAQALGAAPSALEAARADILDALGQTDAALAHRARVVALRPTITSLAALATAHALGGDEATASRLYAHALASYRDVSPFPVAWLLVQRGLTWERNGDSARAAAAFAAAHERLPAYAAAASSLARLRGHSGDHAGAVEILRSLSVTSDDPEYQGQLAGELRALGLAAEADRLRDQAGRGLDALVALHPQAFVAKQVRFWIGPGGDAERGFALAKSNLERDSSTPALALAAEAALAVEKASPSTMTRDAHT